MENDVKNTERPDFRTIAEPLVKYLREYYHPMARIIIDFNSAEIVEGVHGEQFEYLDD